MLQNLAHISQSLLYSWDITLLLCCLRHDLWRLHIYCIVLRWWPSSKSKPIHNFLTNCAPFPSISNPYPFPYGFPLHWRALVPPPGHTSAPCHCQKHPLKMAGNVHKIPTFWNRHAAIFEIYDRLRSYQTYILVKLTVSSRFYLNWKGTSVKAPPGVSTIIHPLSQ